MLKECFCIGVFAFRQFVFFVAERCREAIMKLNNFIESWALYEMRVEMSRGREEKSCSGQSQCVLMNPDTFALAAMVLSLGRHWHH